jgi:hypothetical protein
MFDWMVEVATSVSLPVTAQAQISDTTVAVFSKSFPQATMSPSAVAATSKLFFVHVVRGPRVHFSDPFPTPLIRGD